MNRPHRASVVTSDHTMTQPNFLFFLRLWKLTKSKHPSTGSGFILDKWIHQSDWLSFSELYRTRIFPKYVNGIIRFLQLLRHYQQLSKCPFECSTFYFRKTHFFKKNLALPLLCIHRYLIQFKNQKKLVNQF